jgi:hypothetical protein
MYIRKFLNFSLDNSFSSVQNLSMTCLKRSEEKNFFTKGEFFKIPFLASVKDIV